ncbi:MAG: hypothetical protein SAK29_17645 [Scytonema sp. PMC 1069.18]|nr:hypothetical protein [Scytonema sp. PMC 1069.18]MEC4881230.1 hypothetical protein [Scytonema sp. PMC 1070.18]
MITIYPVAISTSSGAVNYRFSWESALMGVEYLFMGNGSRNKRQHTEEDRDVRCASINVLNAAPELDKGSGRYRYQKTVPI